MARKRNFESALKELEEIVETMEAGDLPLEEAVKQFEKGMSLSKFCSDKLGETEARITALLSGSTASPQEIPFETSSLNGADPGAEQGNPSL